MPTNELSQRVACRKYSLGWHTLKKILAHAEPPGYRQRQPRRKRMLAPFLPVIEQILMAGQQASTKQWHTARRMFERLRDEYGCLGGLTRLQDAVREWCQSRKEEIDRRKRHLMVETLGLLLCVVVPVASIQDRDGAKLVFDECRQQCPTVKLAWGDGNDAGKLVR